MKAKKLNKVYKIDEQEKEVYLAQGYDITDDNGEIVERSPQTTIAYSQYEKVVNELKAVKEELEATKNELAAAKEVIKSAKTSKKDAEQKNGE